MNYRVGRVTIVCFIVFFLLTASFAQNGASQPPTAQALPNNAAAPGGAAPTQPAAGSSTAPAPRAPHFVPILISATDSSGNPVTGLTKDQLAIQDNHQLVAALQLYRGTDLPLHLGIVLLASHPTFQQQQAAAVDLVQKVLRPGVDEGFVITARGKKAWTGERLDWAHDAATLTTTIRGLDPNAGLGDPFSFSLNTDEAGLDRYTLQTFGGGGVSVFDIIDRMMASDPRPSRRVVVMFREPWAHSPGFGTRANTAVEGQLLRVIAAAQQSHVTTFCIGLEDPKFSRSTDVTIGKTYISTLNGQAGQTADYDTRVQESKTRGYDAGKTNIQRLASETGGDTYWSVKKNFPDAVNSIANELAGQYIVTFVPSDVPGPVHPLKITSGNAAHLNAQSAFFYGSGQ